MMPSREQWQMVLALLSVAVVCTLLLGITHIFTQAPIAKAEKEALMQGLMQVLPKHSNDPIQDTLQLTLPHQEQPTTFYFSRDAERHTNAIAWETIAPDGYSGSIHILIAVQPDGKVHAIFITKHKETPGLGDGIVKDYAWLRSFEQTSLSNSHWAVKKDGGDFDQFTGATITPRAVVKAVNLALKTFQTQKEVLLKHPLEAQHE